MMKKITTLICLLCFVSSCAVWQPSLRTKTIDPASLQRAKKDSATAGSPALAIPAGALDGNNTLQSRSENVLKELDERNAQFNNRLKDIISKPKAEGTNATQDERKTEKKKKVSFDFYDTDMNDVIRLFMQILKASFIMHPGLSGRVSLHIEDEFNTDQLWSLLQGVLRINGAAMVQSGQVVEFMPLSEAPRNIPSVGLLIGGEGVPIRGQVIQAFRVKYISTGELVKVIQPYLSKGANVYANDPLGVMLVCDYPHTLEKISKLITLFDESVFANVHMQVYALKYVMASEAIKELEAMSKSFGFSDKNGPGGQMQFLALDRLNMLLVITRDQNMLSFVDAWVAELDRDLPQFIRAEQEEGIYVYYVQNGEAKAIVDSLEGLFQKKTVKTDKKTDKQSDNVPIGQQIKDQPPAQTPQAAAAVTGPNVVSGQLTGDVAFVVDETNNAILVRGTKSDYEKIQSIITKLDLYPKQVLIEVLIADVQLDESSKLGIEWSYLFDLQDDATGLLSINSGLGVISGGTSAIGSGLTYLVTKTNKLTAVLKAFADNNQINVLSSPHILASDNQEARIDIGEEVPIVTSELRTTGTSSTDTTVDKTIQYRDTGLLLTVTPHINEKGLVRMDIAQEVSEISATTVEGVESPVFSKRKATTKLAVQDEQTIVIGGLIKQSKTDGYSGIPVLGRIPLLKYLVGTESSAWNSSELLIFITPHVIKSTPDAQTISSGFLSRLKELKETFLNN